MAGDETITIANMFGKTVRVSNNECSNVKQALQYFFGGQTIPSGIQVQVGAISVAPGAFESTQLRPGDVVIVRTEELARKRQLSGALRSLVLSLLALGSRS